mmetsp:Transcript_26100/g.66421  ORF Transcript_26100/g.66421 Transcript_26100/m.66421 type:complete len:253 (-) Transcript_26100:149-907(-)
MKPPLVSVMAFLPGRAAAAASSISSPSRASDSLIQGSFAWSTAGLLLSIVTFAIAPYMLSSFSACVSRMPFHPRRKFGTAEILFASMYLSVRFSIWFWSVATKEGLGSMPASFIACLSSAVRGRAFAWMKLRFWSILRFSAHFEHTGLLKWASSTSPRSSLILASNARWRLSSFLRLSSSALLSTGSASSAPAAAAAAASAARSASLPGVMRRAVTMVLRPFTAWSSLSCGLRFLITASSWCSSSLMRMSVM